PVRAANPLARAAVAADAVGDPHELGGKLLVRDREVVERVGDLPGDAGAVRGEAHREVDVAHCLKRVQQLRLIDACIGEVDPIGPAGLSLHNADGSGFVDLRVSVYGAGGSRSVPIERGWPVSPGTDTPRPTGNIRAAPDACTNTLIRSRFSRRRVDTRRAESGRRSKSWKGTSIACRRSASIEGDRRCRISPLPRESPLPWA